MNAWAVLWFVLAVCNNSIIITVTHTHTQSGAYSSLYSLACDQRTLYIWKHDPCASFCFSITNLMTTIKPRTVHSYTCIADIKQRPIWTYQSFYRQVVTFSTTISMVAHYDDAFDSVLHLVFVGIVANELSNRENDLRCILSRPIM